MRLVEAARGRTRLAASMGLVGGLVLLVKFVAAGKEVVVAREFGVGGGLDALLIAYLIPSCALNVLSGSVQASFVPTYVRTRERDGEAAAAALGASVLTSCVAAALVAAAALALVAPAALGVIAPGFDADRLEQTRWLYLVFVPILPLGVAGAVFAALLNAHGRVAVPAAVPVVTPLLVAVSALCFGAASGVVAIAAAMTAGTAVEAIALGDLARRAGIPVGVALPKLTPETRRIARQLAPMVAAASLMSGTAFVDNAMATYLGAGSVATLGYGNRVVSVLLAVGSAAVGATSLPSFSRLAAREDWTGLRETLRSYARVVVAATVPVTALLFAASPVVVRLLFERGAFGARETLEVALVQQCYLVQVPFFCLGILHVRLISALGGNRLMVWGTAISVTLNAVLDFALMRRFGPAGIALSTSVVYAVSFVYLALAARRLLDRAERGPATDAPDEPVLAPRAA